MSITQLDAATLGKHKFVPRGSFDLPPAYFEERFGYQFVPHDKDELGAGEATALSLDGDITFALIRFRGDPEGRTTLYLPREVQDRDKIDVIVLRVTNETGIHRFALRWRYNAPEL